MFGDPKQHDHMMNGVRRALASPNTPQHLRSHLQQRLRGGNTMQPIPRKTIVGPIGRAPIKTVATTPRYNEAPLKTVVGSTARPPRKDVVGSTARPVRKDVVGSTAAPRPKTTPANLGTGGIKPLGMPAADRGPINAGNPSTRSAVLGNRDANPGRSVDPMPPIQGPPNPTLSWERPQGVSGVVGGGMGPTAKRMGVNPRRRPTPRRSAFFGE